MAQVGHGEADAYTGVAARIKQFDDKHSVSGPPLLIEGWWFFENGAQRQGAIGACCPLIDPPRDQRECLKNRIRYYQEKLKFAKAEFEDCKRMLQGQSPLVARGEWPFKKPSIQEGRRLMQAARALQRKLGELCSQLEPPQPSVTLKPALTAEQREALEAEGRRRRAADEARRAEQREIENMRI